MDEITTVRVDEVTTVRVGEVTTVRVDEVTTVCVDEVAAVRVDRVRTSYWDVLIERAIRMAIRVSLGPTQGLFKVND